MIGDERQTTVKSVRKTTAILYKKIVQDGILRFGKRLHRHPHVLLFASSKAALSHLIKYRKAMADFGGYRYWITPQFQGMAARDGLKELEHHLKGIDISPISLNTARLRSWDLKVIAESGGILRSVSAPTLHVGHGGGFKSRDGGITKYPYEGNAFADIYLEERRSVISAVSVQFPVYAGKFVWSGHKDASAVMTSLKHRDKYREELSIAPDEKAVLVWGSFREESLFHALGEELFDVLETLPSLGYKVILSIHPNEYRVYDPDITPLGPVVDSYSLHEGFIVRDPSDDFVKYVIAADAMICDDSSVIDVALMARCPLILLNMRGYVWEKSDFIKLMDEYPVIETASDVLPALEEVFSDKRENYQLACGRYSNEIIRQDGGFERAAQEASQLLIRGAQG